MASMTKKAIAKSVNQSTGVPFAQASRPLEITLDTIKATLPGSRPFHFSGLLSGKPTI